MAYSYQTHISGGSSPESFFLNFPYLNRAHVHVYINNVETTDFSWANNGTQLQVNGSAASDVIMARRITPTAPVVTFTYGGTPLASSLNALATQLQYRLEELQDAITVGWVDIEQVRQTNPLLHATGVTVNMTGETATQDLPITGMTVPQINVGNCWDADNNRFTAPTDGVYQVMARAQLNPYVGHAHSWYCQLALQIDGSGTYNAVNTIIHENSVLAHYISTYGLFTLDKGQYLTLTLKREETGVTVDVVSPTIEVVRLHDLTEEEEEGEN